MTALRILNTDHDFYMNSSHGLIQAHEVFVFLFIIALLVYSYFKVKRTKYNNVAVKENQTIIPQAAAYHYLKRDVLMQPKELGFDFKITTSKNYLSTRIMKRIIITSVIALVDYLALFD